MHAPPLRYRVPAGTHGIWLLWADRSDQAHNPLRAQLGLPPAGDVPAAAAREELAIVVMAGSRVKETYVLREPFSYDALHYFCRSYHRR